MVGSYWTRQPRNPAGLWGMGWGWWKGQAVANVAAWPSSNFSAKVSVFSIIAPSKLQWSLPFLPLWVHYELKSILKRMERRYVIDLGVFSEDGFRYGLFTLLGESVEDRRPVVHCWPPVCWSLCMGLFSDTPKCSLLPSSNSSLSFFHFFPLLPVLLLTFLLFLRSLVALSIFFSVSFSWCRRLKFGKPGVHFSPFPILQSFC